MGIKERMNGRPSMVDPLEKVYREERQYRGSRLIEKWSRVPELGEGLNKMDEKGAINLSIMLENQARSMSKMTEAQLSTNFQGFTPENMLRLIRLAYPNSIRGKLFTEFAMETVHDSIKYVRPVYTNSQTGASLDAIKSESGDFNTNGANDFNDADYRKAMYESSEDRYATELASGTVAVKGGSGTDDYLVSFTGGAFGSAGANYIDGYGVVYYLNEKQPLAIQSRDGEWYPCKAVMTSAAVGYKVLSVVKDSTGVYTVNALSTADGGATWVSCATDIHTSIKAFGRFDSEGDLTGAYLGEVELVMTDYQFKPRALSLGVTWTQLTELTLDTSFGVSSEEILLDSAGQEIKKALDFRAVKFAYQNALAHAQENYVEFNAEAAATTDDSYFHTAQLIEQPISRIGDIQLNNLLRGGVSRIVGGPAACTYLKLNKGFTTKGAQPAIGGHQLGELNGIPVFKVPNSIIPDDELLTVWKNDANESDVAIAFGTLLPFYSTGVIQRKNFYKEAGIARFEDQQALMPRYLGRIKINGIRELN